MKDVHHPIPVRVEKSREEQRSVRYVSSIEFQIAVLFPSFSILFPGKALSSPHTPKRRGMPGRICPFPDQSTCTLDGTYV